jgi:hypothetical protein
MQRPRNVANAHNLTCAPLLVGYGLPGGTNAFFENCPTLQVVLYFQMLFSMMFNAFLIAFFYSRVARCDQRGAQVILSKKALLTVVNGQVYFQVRVYDVDAANPVIEARIRMYAVMKSRPVPRPLRILDPNDELGGKMTRMRQPRRTQLCIFSWTQRERAVTPALHALSHTSVHSSCVVLELSQRYYSSR